MEEEENLDFRFGPDEDEAVDVGIDSENYRRSWV